MSRFVRASLLLVLLPDLASCGGSRRAAREAVLAGVPAPKSRPDLLTRADMEKAEFNNLYELIRTLRFRWLEIRGGPDTFMGQQGEVQVRLDDSPLGGVAILKSMTKGGIAYIQYIPPVDAGARWGTGYGYGAIYISTRDDRKP